MVVQNGSCGSDEGITRLNPALKPNDSPLRKPTRAELREAFLGTKGK